MKLKKPEKSEMDLNMTSMLDIVFQLIIFFILVTNFAAADLPPLEPPDPIESKGAQD
jgi:biopolymer transport protein ExbD